MLSLSSALLPALACGSGNTVRVYLSRVNDAPAAGGAANLQSVLMGTAA